MRGDRLFVLGVGRDVGYGRSWNFCATENDETFCSTFSEPTSNPTNADRFAGVQVAPSGDVAVVFGANVDHETTANVFVAHAADWMTWEAPPGVNALGAIFDVAISPSETQLALLSQDGIYVAPVEGGEALRWPLPRGAREYGAVAWVAEDVVAALSKTQVLSAVAQSGQSAFPDMPLASQPASRLRAAEPRNRIPRGVAGGGSRYRVAFCRGKRLRRSLRSADWRTRRPDHGGRPAAQVGSARFESRGRYGCCRWKPRQI